jgi:glycerol-3-phosphate dehydrogenase
MKRELYRLSENEYDLLVIGGGVFGLFIAWDAALRGLSVALVDKSDFGSGTSSNSMRIMHGGFRYLRFFDLRSARRHIREQAVFRRMAPHLVHPMPVMIPVYGNFLRKESLAVAVRVYSILATRLSRTRSIGRAELENRALSAKECMEIIPSLKHLNLKGGIIFTDCQI